MQDIKNTTSLQMKLTFIVIFIVFTLKNAYNQKIRYDLHLVIPLKKVTSFIFKKSNSFYRSRWIWNNFSNWCKQSNRKTFKQN